jgi:hypothetical protein
MQVLQLQLLNIKVNNKKNKMASTGLLPGVNPYRGGNVAIDFTSKPLQLILQMQQKREAKAEAIDKYYKDYEKSLNSAGLTPEEQKIFTDKLNEVKGFAIKNREKLTNPSKYGYDTQSTVDMGFKELSNYIGGAKQAAGERKAFKTIHDKAIAEGKHVSENYIDIWGNAMKPYGGGYVAPDLTQIKIYDPFDDKKYESNITSNLTPMIMEKEEVVLDPVTNQETGFSKKIKKSILTDDQLQKLGENSLIDFKTKEGTKEWFTELYKDPENIKKVEKRFGEVYKTVNPITGKEVIPTIKSVEDFARAIGIAKVPKERMVSESSPELNNEGKFQEWKRRNNITSANAATNNNALIKALAMQGSQQIFNKAMGGYRTNEVFSDNKSITKLNLPKTIVDPYVDPNAAIGVQKKMKDKGFKYEKSSLTPVFGEDANGKILYAYPKLDDKGNILIGQYDWKNAVDVTYDIQNAVADRTAGSARTSDIIGSGKKPKNKMKD